MPRCESDTDSTPGTRATRIDASLHTRLAGPITCRAYTIANAVRLGNVTLVIADRLAAVSIAEAALIFGDMARRLGPTYEHRFSPRTTKGNDVSALIRLRGVQKVGDLELRAQVDRCGEATLTVGNVRITVCDRDAAERVAAALAAAYDEATHTFARLLPFAELQDSHNRRLAANKARRQGRILA